MQTCQFLSILVKICFAQKPDNQMWSFLCLKKYSSKKGKNLLSWVDDVRRWWKYYDDNFAQIFFQQWKDWFKFGDGTYRSVFVDENAVHSHLFVFKWIRFEYGKCSHYYNKNAVGGLIFERRRPRILNKLASLWMKLDKSKSWKTLL